MNERVVLIAALSVLGFFASLAACAFVVVRMPADWFCRTDRPSLFPHRPEWQRVALRIAKNVLGAVLVVVGAILAIPGVPGQGLLTMLIGVLLLDLPGKRRVERKLFSLPAVRRGANALRARFHREPFLWNEDPPPTDASA